MIKYLDLKKITELHATEYNKTIESVIDSGWFLLGEHVKQFENNYKNYTNTKHCIACANGLDALTLIISGYKALGILKDGDEIIVPANTYIATILSITANNLRPIFVEPDINTLQIDETKIQQAITKHTKAIMIVHLYGTCAYTENIENICKQYNLLLFEDNAQAHGCTYKTKKTGSLSHAAAHSFYPGKNLGAFGDAGAITTNEDNLAEVVRTLANYGSHKKYVFQHKGRNSRMDEIQAAVLNIKLKYLDNENTIRKNIANRYKEEIKNPKIFIHNNDRDSVYHVFPIFCNERDYLQKYLINNGIETIIHYPIPPHKQECYTEYNNLSFPITEEIHRNELSIPCNHILTNDEVSKIIYCLNSF